MMGDSVRIRMDWASCALHNIVGLTPQTSCNFDVSAEPVPSILLKHSKQAQSC
jgi:hypothetical protein